MIICKPRKASMPLVHVVSGFGYESFRWHVGNNRGWVKSGGSCGEKEKKRAKRRLCGEKSDGWKE